MSWLAKLFSAGVGEIVQKVGSTLDLNGEKKHAFEINLEALLQKRDSEIEETLRTELQAKERVLVAELQQGDNYTKRARPTVVYAGLLFVVVNAAFKFAGAHWGIPLADLNSLIPNEFWLGWSGIVATWSIGRSFEKRGSRSRMTSMVTGSKLLGEGN